MQFKINRNYFWSNILIDQLVECGIKYACISPGSRSTPITYAISQNKKIKSFVIVDERTSGFFALGIAKQTQTPVLVITTSGTATAELYPAIIEAYQNRVPLIICTADRPAHLRNSGANQTINQDNIYKNHIRYFFDSGLPHLGSNKIEHYRNKIITLYNTAAFLDRGPVHLNLPFDKPLEPDSFTDVITDKILKSALPVKIETKASDTKKSWINKQIENIYKLLLQTDSALITVGPGTFTSEFIDKLEKFSIKYSIPIFSEASSGLPFKINKLHNLVQNFDALIRCDNSYKLFSPKINIHFGRNATTPHLESFFSKLKTKRYIINPFGDMFDSTKKSTTLKINESHFLTLLLEQMYLPKDESLEIINLLKYLDDELENIKKNILLGFEKINEAAVLFKVLECIPPDSNLMIGNSIPIRDLDYFSSALNKNINVYQNRGASGIDGIISTALGICAESDKPTYLVIGDLSFYYDINSLLIAKQYRIPLIVILINNNGGSIFRFLPISNHKNILDKYFLTPTDLDFKKLTDAFDADHKELKNYQDISNHLKVSSIRKNAVVYEIKTNSEYSLSVRKKYWSKVNSFIDNYLRNYEA